LLALLTAAAFLIFAQAFMIAPILPRLAQEFGASSGVVGLAVPAYLVPYGAMTLLWGPLSDRVGRRPVILGSLAAFVVLTAATALVDGVGGFITMRVATAIGASGVVPIALVLIGDLFPYQRRGHALGWLFGGMAGGIAVWVVVRRVVPSSQVQSGLGAKPSSWSPATAPRPRGPPREEAAGWPAAARTPLRGPGPRG